MSASPMKPGTGGGGGSGGPLTPTKILLTSLSAMVAETSTFPIDLTKTRLQLHHLPSSSSALHVVGDILRHQGLIGLYQGLSPALLRPLFYTPFRIVSYEHLRNLLSPAGDPASLSLYTKALLGGLSGAIAQVNPTPCYANSDEFQLINDFRRVRTVLDATCS